MSAENIVYYFNQYWACTNPAVLANDQLRPVVFKIWEQCWALFPHEYESRLFDLGKVYKDRLLKGTKSKLFTALVEQRRKP